MEFSESLSVFYSLLISSVLERRRTFKMPFSVLITHLKRILAGPRKVLIIPMKVLITLKKP